MNVESMSRGGRLAFVATALFVVVVGGFVLYAFNPATTRIFPPCPFHWLTGLQCPGCGSLRAIHSVLNGDLVKAFAFNPLMFVAMPFAFWMLFNPAWVYRAWVPWTTFSVLIAYGVARNIPLWPFRLLAP